MYFSNGFETMCFEEHNCFDKLGEDDLSEIYD